MASVVTEHVPGRIVSVENVLSPAECKRLIAEAEAKGFKASAPSGGGHGQTPRTGARTSQFCVIEDEKLAQVLWERVRHAVPTDLRRIKPVPYMNSQSQGDEWGSPVGVSPHMRFYKYNPGQFVLKHDDYRMSRFRYDPKTNQYYYQMTFITLLVYLNDKFQEGKTTFWTKYATVGTTGHCRFIREVEFTEADLKIQPKTGKALINDHMVQHEGEAPTKGTKYIVRTDILHERPVDEARVTTKFSKGACYTDWTFHYEPSCLNYTE
jgi:hypothetical protein